LTFESFNEDYVQRLADGDSATGEHFFTYFSGVLFLKLRVRLRSVELIEDIKQETLLRVLMIVRKGRGVRRPERFGAFVNGVCENVMRELRRVDGHDESWEACDREEPIDPSVDVDAELVNAEARAIIHRIFAVLPEKERRILQAIYLDEITKPEACRIFKVSPAYLRVLLHRARREFRNAYRADTDRHTGDDDEGAESGVD
jgi:RNA polymerase sigma factor (sigma-70 family)